MCLFKLVPSYIMCYCFNCCVQYNVGMELGGLLVKLLNISMGKTLGECKCRGIVGRGSGGMYGGIYSFVST